MPIKNIENLSKVIIKQKKELAELLGYETRNKYSIETSEGTQIAYAAEQQKGFWNFLLRQNFGHWRSFEVHLFDQQKQQLLIAKHPFRFFFQRLEISTPEGQNLGTIQRRFSILTKSFDLLRPDQSIFCTIRAPIWSIWTFRFMQNEGECACIKKLWSGLLKESFTDADNFEVQFNKPSLSENERVLILAAGIYIDLMYFERKAG